MYIYKIILCSYLTYAHSDEILLCHIHKKAEFNESVMEKKKKRSRSLAMVFKSRLFHYIGEAAEIPDTSQCLIKMHLFFLLYVVYTYEYNIV